MSDTTLSPAEAARIATALEELAARKWHGVGAASRPVYELAESMPDCPARQALHEHLSSWREYYYSPNHEGARYLLRAVALLLRTEAQAEERRGEGDADSVEAAGRGSRGDV